MNVDSRDERNDVSLGYLKQQLRALAAVEPPKGLKERLLGAVSFEVGRQTSQWHMGRWTGATAWVGIAATVMVVCGALWFRTPAGPSTGTLADANGGVGRVLAADHNSVRPADINALDSNGL